LRICSISVHRVEKGKLFSFNEKRLYIYIIFFRVYIYIYTHTHTDTFLIVTIQEAKTSRVYKTYILNTYMIVALIFIANFTGR
jgi:hypothetical protein